MGTWTSLQRRLQSLHDLRLLGQHRFPVEPVRMAWAEAPVPGTLELDECML